MLDFTKIVFPTDFSECSNHALDYAVFMAERFDSELHMLHAQVLHAEDPANPTQRFPEGEALLEALERVAHSALGEAAARRDLAVLKVRQAQRRGYDPGSVILDFRREIDAGLIVMGTHGRRGPKRWLLGSVAEDVLRRSSGPLLLVPQAGERTNLERVATVLVPVDFSAASQPAVEYAAELARIVGARLRLLHVVEIPALPSVYGQPLVFDLSALNRRSMTALEDLASRLELKEEPELLVVPGHPATEIVSEASKRDVGLIVMPPHNRGRLGTLLTGRTTDQVVRTAPCPVLSTGLMAVSADDSVTSAPASAGQAS